MFGAGGYAMKPKTSDRRVKRTRALLGEALMDLMAEKPYESITVQDLIDRADVGRSTFYAHFLDKDDLLESRVAELRTMLVEDLDRHRTAAREHGKPTLGFSEAFLAHTREHRGLYRAIVGKPSGAMVEQKLRSLVEDLVRDELRAIAPRRSPSVPPEAMARGVAGVYMALVAWWLDQPDPSPVPDIDRMIRLLVEPGLAMALQST